MCITNTLIAIELSKNIDGGNWDVVRHSIALQWYPATDQLRGIDVYGTKDCNDIHYSVKFDQRKFTQFLFMNSEGN
jgi:hypothetical protein